MSLIIKSKELFSVLNNKEIKILDSRWFLSNKILSGSKEFKKGHIPKALFFDIDDFSDIDSDLPHMVPPKKRFEKLIKEFGITDNDHIIIYDQNGFFSSTRVWFLFHIFGHKKISILDGGLNDWVKNELPITTRLLIPDKKKIHI